MILSMYICEAYNFCCRGTIWLRPLSSLLFHEPFVQASTPHLMFHRSVSFHLNYLLIAEDMLHRFENGPQNPEGDEKSLQPHQTIICSDYYTKIILENKVESEELSNKGFWGKLFLQKRPCSCSETLIGGGRPSPQLWYLQGKLWG